MFTLTLYDELKEVDLIIKYSLFLFNDMTDVKTKLPQFSDSIHDTCFVRPAKSLVSP